ncbi:MAG: hypothetical protein UHN88_01205 [Eubacterium sp.]|nr:hypothetical protein [Eubacterium sp.]
MLGKRIGKIILTVGAVLLVIVMLGTLIRPAEWFMEGMLSDRTMAFAGVEAEPDSTINVISLGDSLSYTSVDVPDLFLERGITAYSCGQLGGSIQEAYSILKAAFETQQPAVVLLETDILLEDDNIAGLQNGLSEEEAQLFPFIRWHSQWKQLFGVKQETPDQFKGYEVRSECVPADPGDYLNVPGEKETGVSLVTGEYLDLINALCEANGAELILYSTVSPITYCNANIASISTCAEKEGIPYLNLNDPAVLSGIGYDFTTDMLDAGADHPNHAGAVKITRYLGEYLSGAVGITDIRNVSGSEKLCEEWTEGAEAYLKRALSE